MTTYTETPLGMEEGAAEALAPCFGSIDLAEARPTAMRKFLADLARAAVRWSTGVWGTLDMVVAVGGFAMIHHHWPHLFSIENPGVELGIVAAVYAGVLFCWYYALGLYDRHSFAWPSQIVASAIAASVLAAGICAVALRSHVSGTVLLNMAMISAAGAITCRLAARGLARWAQTRIMFVGDRAKFHSLERELRRLFRGFYYRPVYVQRRDGMPTVRERDLRQAIDRHCPDEIVVEDDDAIMLGLVRNSWAILQSGCTIRSHSSYFEEMLGQIPIENMDHRGILGQGFTTGSRRFGLAKRPLDIAIAGVGLLVALPVMAAVALGVRLSSRGPIFYSQTRVGRYGRLFRIYKFRTMRTDAEKNGAVWAKTNDSRVTRIGKILRKTRLDELPQLWNILIGDMSFVGPRPERPEFVERLREEIPHYDLRHLVPPGLTGWAQVRYRYGASIEDGQRKLAYDLHYVRHYSPAFDLAICLRTLVAMAKGAR